MKKLSAFVLKANLGSSNTVKLNGSFKIRIEIKLGRAVQFKVDWAGQARISAGPGRTVRPGPKIYNPDDAYSRVRVFYLYIIDIIEIILNN